MRCKRLAQLTLAYKSWQLRVIEFLLQDGEAGIGDWNIVGHANAAAPYSLDMSARRHAGSDESGAELQDLIGRSGPIPNDELLRINELVNELRELGKDPDLVSAALNRLEIEALERDERFSESLEQMRRGERGEWPARWNMED